MERQRLSRDKHSKKGHCRVLPWIAALAVFVMCTALVAARYVLDNDYGDTVVVSRDFYFSTNLTGDPKMAVSEVTEQGSYENEQRSESWSLYGGDLHEVSIEVRNWLDELRISEKDIDYTVTLSAEKPAEDGAYTALSAEELDTLCALRAPDGNSAGATYTLPAEKDDQEQYQARSDQWTLTVNPESLVQYTEGTVITLTVQSVKPYTATLVLDFVLYTTEPQLAYRVVDHTTYCEMILMSKSEADGITLYWPQNISIDSANALTYQEGFVQQEIQTSGDMYTMTISRKLKSGESISLYFFKDLGATDSTDYSTNGADVPMTATINPNYQIGAFQASAEAS